MHFLSNMIYLAMLVAQVVCVAVAAENREMDDRIRALAVVCGGVFCVYMVWSLYDAQVAAGIIIPEPPAVASEQACRCHQ
jgi:hypothetical protein